MSSRVNSALVRARVCERLAFLGVELDEGENAEAEPDVDVASARSAVRVWVVHAREDAIGRAALETLDALRMCGVFAHASRVPEQRWDVHPD